MCLRDGLVKQKHRKDVDVTADLTLRGANLPALSADGEWEGAASQANILSSTPLALTHSSWVQVLLKYIKLTRVSIEPLGFFFLS